MKRNSVVLAFGTFDILHPGHVSYLTQARSLGDRLVVVIARDETVRKLKGHTPIFSEKDRLRLVECFRMVDEAVLGDKIHHCRIIDKIRPDIICLGYDQDITKQKLTEQLRRMDIPIERIIRAKKYKSSHYKSSLIKQRIGA